MPAERDDWAIVEAELGHHAKPGDGWIETLNRLWRKNRFVTSLDGMLKLEFFEGEKYDLVRSDPESESARAVVAKIIEFIRQHAAARSAKAA